MFCILIKRGNFKNYSIRAVELIFLEVVCVLYVFECVCMCAHRYMCIYIDMCVMGVFFYSSSPYFVRQDFSLNLELKVLVRLAGYQPFDVFLSHWPCSCKHCATMPDFILMFAQQPLYSLHHLLKPEVDVLLVDSNERICTVFKSSPSWKRQGMIWTWKKHDWIHSLGLKMGFWKLVYGLRYRREEKYSIV